MLTAFTAYISCELNVSYVKTFWDNIFLSPIKRINTIRKKATTALKKS